MRYKIFKDGEVVNIIVADESFVESYCSKNGYTYEEEIIPEPNPTQPAPTTDERLAMLEQQYANIEDALCEIDASNTTSIATIENALCELDML